MPEALWPRFIGAFFVVSGVASRYVVQRGAAVMGGERGHPRRETVERAGERVEHAGTDVAAGDDDRSQFR